MNAFSLRSLSRRLAIDRRCPRSFLRLSTSPVVSRSCIMVSCVFDIAYIESAMWSSKASVFAFRYPDFIGVSSISSLGARLRRQERSLRTYRTSFSNQIACADETSNSSYLLARRMPRNTSQNFTCRRAPRFFYLSLFVLSLQFAVVNFHVKARLLRLIGLNRAFGHCVFIQVMLFLLSLLLQKPFSFLIHLRYPELRLLLLQLRFLPLQLFE